MSENNPEKMPKGLRFMEIVTGLGLFGASTTVLIKNPDATGAFLYGNTVFMMTGLTLVLAGVVGPNSKWGEGGDDDNGGGGGWDPPPHDGTPSGGGIDREVTTLTVEDIIHTPEASDQPKVLEPA